MPTGAPLLAGTSVTEITSRRFSKFFKPPGALMPAGAAVSIDQWTTLPFVFFTSINGMVWGF